MTMRLTRSSLLETLHQEYVRTARAKGASERRVILHHALRNALLPVVTAIALNLGALLGGNMVVEAVFGWPGLRPPTPATTRLCQDAYCSTPSPT